VTKAGPIARPESRIWLPLAFLLIIATFIVGNLVAFLFIRETQAKDRAIAQNAMVSIEEVGRIIRDIDRERLLVDAHIFASDPEQRNEIEQRISQVEADMMKAAGEYEPFTTFPGEHAIWEDLWQEVGSLRPSLQRVLQLSRANQDAQAFDAMQSIEPSFETINHQADGLIEVNRQAADDAVREIQLFQRRALFLLGSIALGVTAFASFLAWKVTRLVIRQDDQIVRSAELLETRNRELDAFAGRVAHDLGGYLNVINLSAIALSQYVPDQNKLGTLYRGVRKMHALIQDLLTLSRIDHVPSGAVADTTAIALMLEEELGPKIRTDDGLLRIDLEPSEVRSSENLLRQALWNIAENSTKYRRSGVQLEVDVRGRVAAPFYEFRISDNGAGILPDDLAHIFEPLFRAVKARSIPGTGLGLSIVKRVVEASGGTISVTSKVGSGTTFTIRLRLAGEQRLAS
jgi:signal transduction histidine kinase